MDKDLNHFPTFENKINPPSLSVDICRVQMPFYIPLCVILSMVPTREIK